MNIKKLDFLIEKTDKEVKDRDFNLNTVKLKYSFFRALLFTVPMILIITFICFSYVRFIPKNFKDLIKYIENITLYSSLLPFLFMFFMMFLILYFKHKYEANLIKKKTLDKTPNQYHLIKDTLIAKDIDFWEMIKVTGATLILSNGIMLFFLFFYPFPLKDLKPDFDQNIFVSAIANDQIEMLILQETLKNQEEGEFDIPKEKWEEETAYFQNIATNIVIANTLRKINNTTIYITYLLFSTFWIFMWQKEKRKKIK